MKRFQMAALSLHAMRTSDREWLLGQLPVAQRSRLSVMLGELEDLGVPREPVLLDEVAANAAVAPAVPRYPLVDRLRQADPQALLAVLEHEPDAVAVALLSAAHWPWRQQVLDGLSSTGRHTVDAGLTSASGRLPDKALLALCDATLQALEQLPEDYLSGRQDNVPARRRRLLERLTWRR